MHVKPLRLIAGCAVLMTLALLVAAAQRPPARAASALGKLASTTSYLEGELKSKDGSLWVVDQFNILVDEQTQIIEKAGAAEPGAWLIVWTISDGSDPLRADVIVVDRAANASNPRVQFTDVLNRMSGEWWVVGEQLVHVGPSAMLVGNLTEGMLVTVTAQQQELTLEAIKITVAIEDMAQVPLDFEGTIEEIETTRWKVDGRWIDLPLPDSIAGSPAVGKHAEVRALAQADASLDATQIRVPETLEVSVGGVVEDISPGEVGAEVWDVSVFPVQSYTAPYSATVHVDLDTLVDESRAIASPGQWADVVAMPINSDEFQAEVIRVEQTVTVTVGGELQLTAMAAGAGGWAKIGGRTVWFPPEMAGKASAAASTQGETLIEGILLGNGVVWAQRLVPADSRTP
jgi:hypothetical protein